MRTVVLVDAAPGFEEQVESALRRAPGVVKAARGKDRNFDLAILVECADRLALDKFLTERVRMTSGVKGWEIADAPTAEVRKALGI